MELRVVGQWTVAYAGFLAGSPPSSGENVTRPLCLWKSLALGYLSDVRAVMRSAVVRIAVQYRRNQSGRLWYAKGCRQPEAL